MRAGRGRVKVNHRLESRAVDLKGISGSLFSEVILMKRDFVERGCCLEIFILQ